MKIPLALDYAEKNLLSCLMREPSLIRELSVESDHFIREGHQKLLSILSEMEEEGSPIDEVSIAMEVGRRKLESLLGTPEDLSDLFWIAASPRNAKSYLAELEKSRKKRLLLTLSKQIQKDLSDGVLSVEEIVSSTQDNLSKKGENSSLEGEIVHVSSLFQDLDKLYEGGLPPGFMTGWESLDRYWTVRLGEMTVLTGIPNHGKSAWLDNLLVNLMEETKCRCAVYSPENYPSFHHLARLFEIRSRKTLNHISYVPRMTREELREARNFLSDYLCFLDPSSPTIPRLLSRAEEVKKKSGLEILVLDPWNEIEHGTFETSETQYVSEALGKIRRWARKHSVHVVIVAHPSKLYRDKSGKVPVPTPYDISGSAHWRNKPDNCLTVWRDVEHPENGTTIHIQKVRFKNTGHIGAVTLHFDKDTNRYWM